MSALRWRFMQYCPLAYNYFCSLISVRNWKFVNLYLKRCSCFTEDAGNYLLSSVSQSCPLTCLYYTHSGTAPDLDRSTLDPVLIYRKLNTSSFNHLWKGFSNNVFLILCSSWLVDITYHSFFGGLKNSTHYCITEIAVKKEGN